MSDYPNRISVIDPVTSAFERAKKILFQPFDLAKWFALGFSAWLATLGESGGNFNGNFGSGGNHSSNVGPTFRELVDEAMHYIMQNLHWIIPTVIAILFLAFAWGVFLTWLTSRGKFMFLYNVAFDRAEIKRPWAEFVKEADSLFWFRFFLGIIETALLLPLVGGLFFVVGRMLYDDKADSGRILLAVFLGLLLILVGLLCALIHKFMVDFVVPIMYLRRGKCIDAWREFLTMLHDNPGKLTLYILFQIVLGIALGMLAMAAVLITCCIAGCLMILPYLGAVVLLPVTVFERSYSLYYLAQYGPAYNVFATQPIE